MTRKRITSVGMILHTTVVLDPKVVRLSRPYLFTSFLDLDDTMVVHDPGVDVAGGGGGYFSS